jgi:hypothetical protein
MMEWTLAILFGAAAVLFILSFYKTKQSSKDVQQQLDHLSFSLMDEINKLQEKVKYLELDAEITAQEAGYSPDRTKLIEMIDMHRRGYSFESIAKEKDLNEAEVQSLLTPYIKQKTERGTVDNDSSNNA